MRLVHNAKEVIGLRSDLLLSCQYRQVKEVLKIKFTRQFREFCAKNQLRFYITDTMVTHLDFDKSFLDSLTQSGIDKETVKWIKKQPTIVILPEGELKASSHLIIFKKKQLTIEEAFERTKESIIDNIDIYKRLADR